MVRRRIPSGAPNDENESAHRKPDVGGGREILSDHGRSVDVNSWTEVERLVEGSTWNNDKKYDDEIKERVHMVWL
jgi:hypothetical protein